MRPFAVPDGFVLAYAGCPLEWHVKPEDMPPAVGPDAAQYNPDPHYLRGLVEASGLSQERAARQIRLSPRQLRYYLSTAPDHQDAPYVVQFALEQLARCSSTTQEES